MIGGEEENRIKDKEEREKSAVEGSKAETALRTEEEKEER